MQVRVQFSDRQIQTQLTLAGSKSESNRALLIRELCSHPFDILNLSDAKDTQTLLQNLVDIRSGANIIDVGPAGTNMRFLAALLSIYKGEVTLTGDERMQERPIDVLVTALRSLGAFIQYTGKEGYPPLLIKGAALAGGIVQMDASQSSQFISALLMIAPTLQQGLTLKLDDEVVSESYINMTLQLMEHFGVRVEQYANAIIVPPQDYSPRTVSVGGDWSSASYWYEILTLSKGGTVLLKGLYRNGRQGDEQMAQWMESFGIETQDHAEGVLLEKKSTIHPLSAEFNCKDCPDLVPALAVTCAGLGVKAHFSGVGHLRIKESDRIEALQRELGKLGVSTHSSGNSFTIESSAGFQVKESVKTYKDHRMAMAFAPLALKLPSVSIQDPEVVVKSYPQYWEDLKAAGFVLETQAD